MNADQTHSNTWGTLLACHYQHRPTTYHQAYAIHHCASCPATTFTHVHQLLKDWSHADGLHLAIQYPLHHVANQHTIHVSVTTTDVNTILDFSQAFRNAIDTTTHATITPATMDLLDSLQRDPNKPPRSSIEVLTDHGHQPPIF